MNANPKTWSKQQLADWIKSHGSTFDIIAEEFYKNGVEGEDLLDDSVLSKPIYDDMLRDVSNLFSKNKLWKKIAEMKKKSSPPEPFDSWNRPAVLPFSIGEASPELAPTRRDSYSSVFAQNSLNASPITLQSTPIRTSKTKTLLQHKLQEVPRRASYAERLQGPSMELLKNKSTPVKKVSPKKTSPKLQPSVDRMKMMLWRGLDKDARIQPDELEKFLESAFDITFRYAYSSQRFSIYGKEENVRSAIEALKEMELGDERLFDHLYDVDSLELHISPRDCKTLERNEDLTSFVQENDVTMFSEPTDMTKPNGEKKRRLLISGPKMPKVAEMVAEILFRDFSKVYTNYIFTTENKEFNEIMMNAVDPYWRTVARDTDTTVRVLNKSGRRHVLVSGKVSNVLKAKEQLELRLNC